MQLTTCTCTNTTQNHHLPQPCYFSRSLITFPFLVLFLQSIYGGICLLPDNAIVDQDGARSILLISRASLPGNQTERLADSCSRWRRSVLWQCLACLFNGLNRRLDQTTPHLVFLPCSLDRAIQPVLLVCRVCGRLHEPAGLAGKDTHSQTHSLPQSHTPHLTQRHLQYGYRLLHRAWDGREGCLQ